MNPFKDKVAIVTGAASGIGREICFFLARSDAKVVIADKDYKGAREVEKTIHLEGGRGKAVKTDVTKAEEVETLIKETVERDKKIDLMINNAGIGINGEFKDMNLGQWRKIFDVNFWGVLYGNYYVYPVMIKQGFGQIVNVSSLAGLMPGGLMTSYNASKHSVVGFTLSLRSEARQYGIKVNALCPGFIETPIHDASPNVSAYLNSEKNKRPPNKYPTAEKCVPGMMKGIKKDKTIIVAPYYHKIFWWLYRLFPGLIIFMWKMIIAHLKK